MNKIQLVASVLIFSCLLFSCSEQKTDDSKSSKINRNLFGHYIPRGLTKTSEGLTPGYVMFAVPNSASTYLVNRKGEVVHEWKGNYASMHSYLMDDGTIVLSAEDPDYPVFGFGGPYGRIQKINWDGKMLWDFEYATEDHIVHHDFAVLPNGNILAIAYEAKSYSYAIDLGRKPEMISKSGLWLEKIIEIEPNGKRWGKIVWEWYLQDHLIQNYDFAKANYGIPAAHPELLDFNMGLEIEPAITEDSLDILKAAGQAERNQTTDNKGSDIFHFNAIDYHADLDQIVLSSPHLNEIFILDHSTTTEEAASHHGGKSGMGGDFLYRWGNPENYERGDSTDQQLFGQHDVRWIESGKPGAGNLTVFNNHPPGEIDFSDMGNSSTNYSAVFELATPVVENGRYSIDEDEPFGPERPTWKYMAPDTLSFFSSFISGAHRVQNGNTFINEGASGRFFEVTPKGKIVWEYLNPYHGNIHKPNGDPKNPMFMTFSAFRATFIPADHPAFAGKELTPIDPQPKEFELPSKKDKEKK